MSDYIIKIEPDHMPCLTACEQLTLGYMQNVVGGNIEVTIPNSDLRAKYPELRIVVNEEGVLFDLPVNTIATLLHDILRGLIFGTAIMVIVEGEKLRPMTETEAVDIRDTIEQLWGEIRFEEGSKE